ncbi:MAG: histidinol dehydrogenase [Acidobacteriia bacterium]|nr:histidinol dehydrogenase [Terriglobia bacterium]
MMEIVDAASFHRHPRIRRILSRREVEDPQVNRVVSNIIAQVRRRGDASLRQWTRKLDGVVLRSIRIPAKEIERQAARASQEVRRAISAARRNIEQFHRQQLETSWKLSNRSGADIGQRIRPITAAGIYVPGGTAAYPSTVLMNAVPARVAGVKRIVVATPPRNLTSNPAVAAALREMQLEEVYGVGGAQAVAALAYGTATIEPVDKIVGPGNRFVSAAKRLVFGQVDIDMVAGPSEVVVVADGSARADFVAADLLAQAEHDGHASAICISNSRALALQVQAEVEAQMRTLERKQVCRASIDRFGAIVVTPNLAAAEEIVNFLAPEHLELHLRDAEIFSKRIKNAGAIFLGSYSPEATGDYFAGPNHVLPTNGSARFSSALGVYDFLKRTSIIRYSQERLKKDAPSILALARAEGLTAHARSVELRIRKGAGNAKNRSRRSGNARRARLLVARLKRSKP